MRVTISIPPLSKREWTGSGQQSGWGLRSTNPRECWGLMAKFGVCFPGAVGMDGKSIWSHWIWNVQSVPGPFSRPARQAFLFAWCFVNANQGMLISAIDFHSVSPKMAQNVFKKILSPWWKRWGEKDISSFGRRITCSSSYHHVYTRWEEERKRWPYGWYFLQMLSHVLLGDFVRRSPYAWFWIVSNWGFGLTLCRLICSYCDGFLPGHASFSIHSM